uniref:C-type lectin domain-containing protein n=1 Tax=Stegastes partitus TaxID=144197 RepID=A0A3B4ZIJ1_9TELE
MIPPPSLFIIQLFALFIMYNFPTGTGCNAGTPENRTFVAVETPMTWSDAQRYCRKHYDDLATVRSFSDEKQLQQLLPQLTWHWIGLHSNRTFYWSDGSRFHFSFFQHFLLPNDTITVLCASTSLQMSMNWKLFNCRTRFPFVRPEVETTA